MKKLFTVILSIFCLSALAQNGTIRGTVFEDASGEPVIGANVVIKGTYTGTQTDLDGKFSISIEPGTYDVLVSFITYQSITIEGVIVKANDVTVIDNIALKEDNFELEEMVITAKAIKSSEAAILTLKKKSATMMDGISAAKFELIGDATAVEAAKRVTGVSIEGGKYVYVRGLGDRYTKTTLNGVDIPGLDPDRNSLQMDIFPSNLIDNMVISKNFTAELPADFTGGILNVETKDFPEKKIVSASFGISFNPSMHFNKDNISYDGGNYDFLGFDDGTRALPDGADGNNIPTPISGASDAQTRSFIQSFNPTLGAENQTSFLDYSLSFSLGNQISLGKANSDGDEKITNNNKLGYIFSLSYKNDVKYYNDVIYGEYQRPLASDEYEMKYATLQNGFLGERNVLIGLLGGLAYKTKFSKYKLMVMRLQNGESRAGQFDIDNNAAAIGQSGYLAKSDNLEYNQRSLTNLLLNGTHVKDKTGWEIDWRVSPTFSTSNDPDIRKTAYTYTAVDTFFSAGAGGNPARIWRSLSEVNLTGKLDFTKKYKLFNEDAKLWFGASHTYKIRDYEILFFDLQFFGAQSWPDPDPNTVLDPINIYPNRPNSIYYQSGNETPNPNEYSSNINNTGVYISNEFRVAPKLKSVLGVRAENYVQRHTGRDQTYASGDTANGKNLEDEVVLESLDFFPSVNIIYELTDEQNLRGSFTQTIARPSFKELSFAQILDPITNRIFNGSLFTYSDWDGKLTETYINNFDIRWEWFLKEGQIFSFSIFYKQFTDPIELVRIPEQQTSTEYQPRNVGDGELIGIEFEFKKKLTFISPFLNNFNINGNFTYVESQIDMTSTEYNSRKTFEKNGQTIDNRRQMAGQAPYVINAGLQYQNIDKGIEAGLFYNVKGPTLFIVGAGLFPDIYNESFHSLSFSINKKIGEEKNTTIDFKAGNILNDVLESYYESYGSANQPFSSLTPGRTFSIGISHKF